MTTSDRINVVCLGKNRCYFEDVIDYIIKKYDASESVDILENGTNILFGVHEVTRLFYPYFPDNVVIFNTEQLYYASEWVNVTYIDTLKNHKVLDYCKANQRWLKQEQNIDADLFEFSFTESKYRTVVSSYRRSDSDDFRRSNSDERVVRNERTSMSSDNGERTLVSSERSESVNSDNDDFRRNGTSDVRSDNIDVLFYGTYTEDRWKVLEAFKQQFPEIKVVFEDTLWGQKKTDLINRSRIILNLHRYETKRFQIIKVFPLLGSKLVVSERCSDEDDYKDLRNLIFCDIDKIPSLVHNLLKTND